jgi:hypothetical protein
MVLGMNGLGFSHNHIEKLQELNNASFQQLTSSIQAKTMHGSDKRHDNHPLQKILQQISTARKIFAELACYR